MLAIEISTFGGPEVLVPVERSRPVPSGRRGVSGGGYAEFCAAPAVPCLPVRRGLDMVAAGAIPETSFTVWSNVFERGRLKPGEWIVIHGGSSGIGTIAIQLAHVLASHVLATAGSAEKCAARERLGAERAINYRETAAADAHRLLESGQHIGKIVLVA